MGRPGKVSQWHKKLLRGRIVLEELSAKCLFSWWDLLTSWADAATTVEWEVSESTLQVIKRTILPSVGSEDSSIGTEYVFATVHGVDTHCHILALSYEYWGFSVWTTANWEDDIFRCCSRICWEGRIET
jgi:hypothetical protein